MNSEPRKIEGASRHLSPWQFGGLDSGGISEGEPDGLDGPLGSYGEPAPVGVGFIGMGVRARAGSGI